MRIHILHLSTGTCYWNSRRNAIVLHNSVMVGADSVDTPEHDAASSWQTPEHVRYQAQQRLRFYRATVRPVAKVLWSMDSCYQSINQKRIRVTKITNLTARPL